MEGPPGTGAPSADTEEIVEVERNAANAQVSNGARSIRQSEEVVRTAVNVGSMEKSIEELRKDLEQRREER